MTISEENKKQIKEHRKKMCELQNEINHHEEEIIKLEGKTEKCPHCNGEGKHEIGHSFRDGIIYQKCIVCRGVGKITKARLEEYNKDGAKFIWKNY